MNTEFAATRKPFYQRIDAGYVFDGKGWHQWHDSDSGVALLPYDGNLELKDKGVEALPLDEPLGSFAGLTTPKGVVHGHNALVLVADSAGGQILCYSPAFKHLSPAFKPLWSKHGLDAASPYRLDKPLDILLTAKAELVICDAGKQQVLWLQWPSLRLKHIETFSDFRPVALASSIDDGYIIALNPLKGVDKTAILLRIDSSYSRQKPLLLPRWPGLALNAVDALATLSDHSLLVLRRPDPEASVAAIDAARVWQLGEFAFNRSLNQWQVGLLQARHHSSELNGLRGLLPPLILRDGQLYQHYQPNLGNARCVPVLLENSGVNRRGTLLWQAADKQPGEHPVNLVLVSLPKRIRMRKSRRLISPPIEGDSDQFSWDRLLLQTRIVENTSVVVQSKTSDRLLSDAELIDDRQQPWSAPVRLDVVGSPQVLVQSLPGRYLYLSLEMYGDGYNSSPIAAINIEAPRHSALQWLPPAYHQDPQSRHFLDRFLSYFDVVFDSIGFQADHFARYLSPHSSPDEDFLNWLASWFDWQFFPPTPVAKKREIIAQLMDYYTQRGTMAGLQRLLRWYTGLRAPFPQIVEHFVFRRFLPPQGAKAVAGPARQLAFGGKKQDLTALHQAHYFSVFLPVAVATAAATKERLRQMIAAQKPAHTRFDIVFFPSRCVIGCQSTIGTDMVIGNRRAAGLDHRVLGVDTLLT